MMKRVNENSGEVTWNARLFPFSSENDIHVHAVKSHPT